MAVEMIISARKCAKRSDEKKKKKKKPYNSTDIYLKYKPVNVCMLFPLYPCCTK